MREPPDLDKGFAAIKQFRAGALIVHSDPVLGSQRPKIVAFANGARLPAMYGFAQWPRAGGLMSYGPSLSDMYRRAAGHIDKILRGAKPGELPVERPVRFDLVINMKTAKALGLAIPPSILLRANQVIE